MKSFALLLLATFALADDAKVAGSPRAERKTGADKYSTLERKEQYPNYTAPSYKNLDAKPRADYNVHHDDQTVIPPYVHQGLHEFKIDKNVVGEAGYQISINKTARLMIEL